MTEPILSYTARDYPTVLQQLISRIKSRFPNDWPEFLNTGIGKSILDVVAWAHGQRAFYYDMQALNCFLETATLPESVMAIARQLGYERRMATAASVSVIFTPTPSQPVPVTIRQGEKLSVDEIKFLLEHL